MIFGDGGQTVGVVVSEGAAVDVGVEARAVVEAFGVGGKPAAKAAIVVPSAEIGETGFGVEAFTAVAPGVEGAGSCFEFVGGIGVSFDGG